MRYRHFGFINEDHFKLYLSDIGILLNLLKIKYNDIILDRLLLYKGIIAENYVATQLLVNKHPLIYWESRKSGGSGFYFI